MNTEQKSKNIFMYFWGIFQESSNLIDEEYLEHAQIHLT